MSFEELKAKVLKAIQIGSVFYINRDAYSLGEREQKAVFQRRVIGIFPNVILTEDSFGNRETYQYYDILSIMGGLSNGGSA